MHDLVIYLENQLQQLMRESQRLQEESRQLLAQRLTQVHALQDEVQVLREQLQQAADAGPLMAELERLHREVESWRSQHAALHIAWQADRRALEEWERRWSERQRISQLAQQLKKTIGESACSSWE